MTDSWRVVQELKRDLTEEEARNFMGDFRATHLYAVNDSGDHIISHDGPLTSGRPVPDFGY